MYLLQKSAPKLRVFAWAGNAAWRVRHQKPESEILVARRNHNTWSWQQAIGRARQRVEQSERLLELSGKTLENCRAILSNVGSLWRPLHFVRRSEMTQK